MTPMSGYLVTRKTSFRPRTRCSVRRLYALCQRQPASLYRKAQLSIERRYERSIFTGFPHFGHLSSITPVVGVILSKTRQPQFGHFLDTRKFFLVSGNVIISRNDIQYFIRMLQMLLA